MPIRTGVSPSARLMNGDVTCSAAATAAAFKIVRRPITAERCEAFISSSQNNLLLLTAASCGAYRNARVATAGSECQRQAQGSNVPLVRPRRARLGTSGGVRTILNEIPRTHWAVIVCLAVRAAGCDETRGAATPFMCQRNGKLFRGRPRRNVDEGTPRNWCRLSMLI